MAVMAVMTVMTAGTTLAALTALTMLTTLTTITPFAFVVANWIDDLNFGHGPTLREQAVQKTGDPAHSPAASLARVEPKRRLLAAHTPREASHPARSCSTLL